MTKEERDLMKKDRLRQYEANMFALEMDIVAAKAVNDEYFEEETIKKLEDMKKAYAAVEAM